MKSVDLLVVGGSAAGTTAAEVFRSLKPQSSITIVSDEPYEEYSRILLSNYLRGEIARDKLFLKKPSWYQEKNIEFVKGVKADSLESASHRVKVSTGGEYQYGKLLITTGGSVIRLPITGDDLGNVFYLRTLDDADAILAQVVNSRQAVIIGGGFISLDFATCFRANGVEDVLVLVIEDYYWQGKLDRDSSQVLQKTLEKNGVKVLTNEEVAELRSSISIRDRTPVVREVVTKSGKTFEADIVGIGVGIKTDLDWFKGSGIKVNRGIVTNEYLETNVPDIYAAGDCAEFWDVIFKRQHIMGNWANATSQGLAVGKTIAGVRTVFETASSYSADFFDRPRVDTSRSTGTAKSPRVEAGGHCSFIGVTDESFADEVVTRGTVAEGKMTRIFIKEISGTTRIVGATVINNPAEVGPLTMAVKGKIDISVHKGSLADANFDLKNLVS
ncbi:hypothetical protein A2W45_03425 [Candidatus Curtissbacteria bacterium RIFCSPHIGHO2_12_41_11]|uniref:FAD/NAD(P)-binding domain-containing protein n=3 Tax=Candidatus Curtissiibacteriota TaxID=1752717 RepID=A0A1F5HTT6_9BACT|nr:MAG: FAD-dependent pyridine nucleotide-disulfide oxidoreductase [Candidatus Curtissbacteria bacterium GW2011_GWA2_41_24]OGD98506.1 MAG: hypothetical protein A2W45_03425 [Candidatus Curtissbacteria bacterium RIFCSPHIGHO2_12_41_11]OGE07375.1 MAG: hypothetical protein A2W70_03220 [Candidatus Curtissbacteria bacterium RIFCSPLOWO2_02_41_11]